MGAQPKQLDLATGIMGPLNKQGFRTLTVRQMNACVEAADLVCAALEREPVRATANMGLEAWLASDDVGMSSLAMAHVLAGTPRTERCEAPGGGLAYSYDPADFGRCIGFLAAVQINRRHLGLMAQAGPVWAAYVARWDEMERLWEEESPSWRCPKLYDLMQTIREGAEDPKPSTENKADAARPVPD